MKLYIYTSQPESVLQGDFFCSLRTTDDKEWHDKQPNFVFLGEIEFEYDADASTLRQYAVDAIDAEMEIQRQNFTAGMEELKAKKESLLAIEYKPDDNS